jgi:hypothetical protein
MDKERIAEYLASGVPPVQVASIVGVTPSAIAQLAKEEGFKDLLETKVQELASQPAAREEVILNSKYSATEHRLLDAMGGAIATAELPAITRALEVVANRQEARLKRLTPAAPAQQINVIQLTLPSHAIPEYKVNERSEVVAIGNQAMASLSAGGVRKLFQDISETKAAAVELGFTEAEAKVVNPLTMIDGTEVQRGGQNVAVA